MQYFELFNLPPTFDIDKTAIEQIYRRLAAQFHPDKYAAASSFEQRQAMMMASTVNEAYRMLKSPTDRAAYLLQAQGINADAPEHTAFPPEFLMQQMEWRETLEDARAERNESALNALDQEITNEQDELLRRLSAAFAESQTETAAMLVRQCRFLDKLRKEIQSALP
ncbi:Fe-S protein assembly co-chaperone HscB [Neisseria wadsworthii]|uniref:Co-chaperone protein HscB homolog n=1 Tax=Neisseria wadsworthii 9715 TaxID=1030841 RepID=G4CR60_9NEIS|nr:Fe-S protein assembly co-chaperone HscB [Neisseria wadsworthii]EGZ45473.1 co-chaperone protein HscB [Neisseria wadsworthii 9715]QMT35274.1 Fe-S protein assembly co-chaperone HscB [Neisseria wadsworthii]